MRLLAPFTELVVVWLPLVYAAMLFALAFYAKDSTLAIDGGTVVLIVAMYKALE